VRQLTYSADGLDRTLLIADKDFLVEHVTVTRNEAYVDTDGLPLTITTMDAHVRVDTDENASALLEPWQSVVTPASAPRVALVPGGERTSALLVHVRPNLARARERAVAAGVAAEAADAFFRQFG
jgi:hypothetical protein